jgi:hypothetical protein
MSSMCRISPFGGSIRKSTRYFTFAGLIADFIDATGIWTRLRPASSVTSPL